MSQFADVIASPRTIRSCLVVLSRFNSHPPIGDRLNHGYAAPFTCARTASRSGRTRSTSSPRRACSPCRAGRTGGAGRLTQIIEETPPRARYARLYLVTARIEYCRVKERLPRLEDLWIVSHQRSGVPPRSPRPRPCRCHARTARSYRPPEFRRCA